MPVVIVFEKTRRGQNLLSWRVPSVSSAVYLATPILTVSGYVHLFRSHEEDEEEEEKIVFGAFIKVLQQRGAFLCFCFLLFFGF